MKCYARRIWTLISCSYLVITLENDHPKSKHVCNALLYFQPKQLLPFHPLVSIADAFTYTTKIFIMTNRQGASSAIPDIQQTKHFDFHNRLFAPCPAAVRVTQEPGVNISCCQNKPPAESLLLGSQCVNRNCRACLDLIPGPFTRKSLVFSLR